MVSTANKFIKVPPKFSQHPETLVSLLRVEVSPSISWISDQLAVAPGHGAMAQEYVAVGGTFDRLHEGHKVGRRFCVHGDGDGVIAMAEDPSSSTI